MAFTPCDWNEDVWKGATAGCSAFVGLYNVVAAEEGIEKASEMLKKLGTATGTQHGEMVKGQLGDKQVDSHVLSEAIVGLDSAFGAKTEIEHEDDAFTLRIHECPLAAAYGMMGIDHETGKRICEEWGVTLFQSMMKVLAPNGNYELVRYRDTWDDYCEERYSVGD